MIGKTKQYFYSQKIKSQHLPINPLTTAKVSTEKVYSNNFTGKTDLSTAKFLKPQSNKSSP